MQTSDPCADAYPISRAFRTCWWKRVTPLGCSTRRLAAVVPEPPSAAELDALYAWATVHGLASTLQSSAMDTLPLARATKLGMERHVMQRPRAASTADISDKDDG